MAEQREAVQFLTAGGLSVQRGCPLIGVHRATFRYVAHPADDAPLLAKVQELATRHPRYGYRRMSALIRRKERVNQKRVRRLWKLTQLQVKRARRLRPKRTPSNRLIGLYPGHVWAYDVVEDALMDGTPLRILTVMDEFTRAGLTLDVAPPASAERVIGVLTGLFAQHGPPEHLRSDNGPEFVATALKRWLAECGVQTEYIDPGKPWQNGKEERFNGTVRDECLTMYRFKTVAEAWLRLSAFRQEYNTYRPHSSLGDLAPQMFKTAWLEAKAKSEESHMLT
ncbi:MAG: IS3 family transposase [Oscillochloris sp.]|nr:IS3 family transposase [Oscillochloris sp.]